MNAGDHEPDEQWGQEKAEDEADRLRKLEPAPALSNADFLAWRSPRRGASNPSRQDNPLWNWLVRTCRDAYNANNMYSGPSSFDAGPMWTFDRFGKSETMLPDGRVVHIGGEHEDYYDPDFFIYNDVTVVDPGGAIAIHGYPEQDFPPTDFHTATLVGDEIFIIGRLGYHESRIPAITPVFRLSLDSMRIDAVSSSGEFPGWLYGHSAQLADDGRTIVVSAGQLWLGEGRADRDNVDRWSFDTRSAKWHRLTAHNWQQWVMRRIDKKPNRLWEMRQSKWVRDHPSLGIGDSFGFGDDPRLALFEQLYRIGSDCPMPEQGSDAGEYRTEIDGLTVRFKENQAWVSATVEGQLSPERLSSLQATTLALLGRIDGAEYEIESDA